VLTEGNPTEALTRNAFIDAVKGASYDVIDTARTAQSRFGELREQAEAELAEVERLTEQLDEEVAELEGAREVRDGRRQDWLGRIDQIEAEEQDLTNQIIAEQRRRDNTDALDALRSTEGYVWPTDGGIGSYFGNRVHPVLGYSRLHGGLDIGGRMGQPIWAAKEGVVIMAGRNGGYGNTIVVDHGNGVATLYGHQSSFVISKGDYVETGQHIGNVGSTGLSTGPHLHFEVRIDGGVVDPLPYLPPR
jgi:murein DD-endopeptidase MepM/ murein hydrolase activator NlpD